VAGGGPDVGGRACIHGTPALYPLVSVLGRHGGGAVAYAGPKTTCDATYADL
jgi:hypothetical protein